jgi:hypothetical protein
MALPVASFAPPAPVASRPPAVKLAKALSALGLAELRLELDIDRGAVAPIPA